jgi:hypothetical protein
MQHAPGLFGGEEVRHLAIEEIDARRHHQPVVAERGAARERDAALGGVDRGRLVVHHPHAMLAEAFVAAADIGKGLGAAEHQVGSRAGDEIRAPLDQRHLDRRVP